MPRSGSQAASADLLRVRWRRTYDLDGRAQTPACASRRSSVGKRTPGHLRRSHLIAFEPRDAFGLDFSGTRASWRGVSVQWRRHRVPPARLARGTEWSPPPVSRLAQQDLRSPPARSPALGSAPAAPIAPSSGGRSSRWAFIVSLWSLGKPFSQVWPLSFVSLLHLAYSAGAKAQCSKERPARRPERRGICRSNETPGHPCGSLTPRRRISDASPGSWAWPRIRRRGRSCFDR